MVCGDGPSLAATVRRLAHPDARPEDFLRPGHVFPLRRPTRPQRPVRSITRFARWDHLNVDGGAALRNCSNSPQLWSAIPGSQREEAPMTADVDLTRLLIAIGKIDHKVALGLLDATPSLATAKLWRRDEFFLAERLAQV